MSNNEKYKRELLLELNSPDRCVKTVSVAMSSIDALTDRGLSITDMSYGNGLVNISVDVEESSTRGSTPSSRASSPPNHECDIDMDDPFVNDWYV